MMVRPHAMAALAMLALTAPALAAQDGEARVYTLSDNRGRLGIMVDIEADADRDKLGAEVESVTSESPAEKAGLKAGDIITKFNGKALGGIEAADEEESGPARRLLSLARKLEPGDTVQVEYRRGNETKRATIVAADLGGNFSFKMAAPRVMERFRGLPRGFAGGGDMPAHFEFFFDDQWGQLELVTLNPDLGEYFGTNEGILVIKAPADSGVSLKSGDVILAIDGRKPTSPSHAMRILRSYEAGETVKLEVMRKKSRTTVNWTVPDRETRTKVRARTMHPGMHLERRMARERQEAERT